MRTINLFKLVGSVIIDDKASSTLSNIEKNTDKASKKIEGFKKGFANLGKVAVAGTVATVGAISVMTKKVVGEGAKLEQSIGGIETLYKGSADTMIKYAENAYKTTGQSANEYMEQVTGFSASLIQSVGGDTEKASKISHMAMVDMSDNANKMGTNIEDVQNAYQGFAKQNYTIKLMSAI